MKFNKSIKINYSNMRTLIFSIIVAFATNPIFASHDTCCSGDNPVQSAINMANQRKTIENTMTNFNLASLSANGHFSYYQFETDGKVTLVSMSANGKTKTEVWKWTLSNRCHDIYLTLYVPFTTKCKEYIVKSTPNGMVWSEDFTEKEIQLSFVAPLEEDEYCLMESDIIGAWKGNCFENQETRLLFSSNGTFHQLSNESVVSGKWSLSRDGKFLNLISSKSKTSMKVIRLESDKMEVEVEKGSCQKSVMTFNKLKQTFNL